MAISFAPRFSAFGLTLLALASVSGAQAGRSGLTPEPRPVREPPYNTAPRYCLLTFGADADTRVWLVLDGDTLYVDRNGNGNLTEPGEKVAGKDGVFQVGELREKGGERHVGVTVAVDQPIPQIDGTYKTRPYEIVMSVRGRYRALSEPTFASTPAAAPILRFNAPLRLDLIDPQQAGPGQVIDPRFLLRTRGVGDDAIVMVDLETIPRDLHPVAEFEFTTPDGAKRHSLVLRRRCCGGIFMDAMQVPPLARGKIKGRAHYADWKDAVVEPSELEIPLH